jgi:hypothetical protein
MFNSNFKIFLRRIRREKSFFLLNISGLSVGVAVRDRIYGVISTETYRNGLVDYDGCAPTPLVSFENHPYPEDFEVVVRAADSNYLSIFHVGLVAGRFPYISDTVREILINENAAGRLGFRSPSDIVGRFLRMDVAKVVSFMALQKTKEMDIRKVLGASVQNIVYLFSKEFTLLIGIAFVISAWITVGTKAVKAAMANPVKSLRTE